MLKQLRIALALTSIVFVTLLFVDFTGLAHHWLGWMAKIQFLPALLALNFVVVVALVAVTLLLRRVYCSVICPLGIMQDIFAWFGKKSKKYRYSYSPRKNVLRIVFFCIMVVAIFMGSSVVVSLFAPYSAYGRIASSLMAPVRDWVNNLFADIAAHYDSYAFYHTETVVYSWVVLELQLRRLSFSDFFRGVMDAPIAIRSARSARCLGSYPNIHCLLRSSTRRNVMLADYVRETARRHASTARTTK